MKTAKIWLKMSVVVPDVGGDLLGGELKDWTQEDYLEFIKIVESLDSR